MGVKKCINVKRVYISGDSYPEFLLCSSPPPLPNSASLYPHHPSLIWIPFLGSIMGLLVWLMHCDLLQLTVYLFMCKIKKRRWGVPPLFLKGKQEQNEVKTGTQRERSRFNCFSTDLFIFKQIIQSKTGWGLNFVNTKSHLVIQSCPASSFSFSLPALQ